MANHDIFGEPIEIKVGNRCFSCRVVVKKGDHSMLDVGCRERTNQIGQLRSPAA